MCNFTDQFQNLNARPRLRCVWVLTHEGECARLAARWVATRQEPCEQQQNEAVAVCAGDEEPPAPARPATHLRAA
jgi:hypothetical protein